MPTAGSGPDCWQEQVEELVALRSICGPNFVLLGGLPDGIDLEDENCTVTAFPQVGGGLECQVAVHVDLPQGRLALQVDDGAVPSTSGIVDGKDLVHISHLPPICLHLTFPGDYPAASPPHFSLSALWLTPSDVAILTRELQQLWDEQGCQLPICYTWVDWLQTSALENLGVSHHLALRNVGVPAHQCHHHRSGSSGSSGSSSVGVSQVEEKMVQLLRFDAAQDFQLFQQGHWECSICYEEVAGVRCVRLPCRHHFCEDCMRQHASLHVREGNLEQLCCPAPRCQQPLTPQVLGRVLSSDEVARWEELTLLKTLDRMADLAYCPRCSTPCVEDRDHCAQCPKCFFAFCSVCEQSWHAGGQCVTAEMQVEILRRRMAGQRVGAVEELKRREQEFMSIARIKETSKQCPSCNMAIQKSEGCNKMVCGNCGAFFCYRCNALIAGYEHFKEGKCILFDLDEIQRWNDQWEAQFDRQVRQVQNDFLRQEARVNGVLRMRTCPHCGHENYKQLNNNNWLTCWACTNPFCYLCQASLRQEGGRHFGKNKNCKQHSQN